MALEKKEESTQVEGNFPTGGAEALGSVVPALSLCAGKLLFFPALLALQCACCLAISCTSQHSVPWWVWYLIVHPGLSMVFDLNVFM